MNYKLCLPLLIALIVFSSCSSGNKTTLQTTYEGIVQDLNTPVGFRKKYKNKDVYITGIVKYIGEPKDSAPNKDSSYIEIAGNDDLDVIIYFDYLISNDVKVDQKINVKCSFRRLYRANYFCNEDLVEFYNGELLRGYE